LDNKELYHIYSKHKTRFDEETLEYYLILEAEKAEKQIKLNEILYYKKLLIEKKIKL